MANKYAKFSKVEEAIASRNRMSGALKTCARKKVFRNWFEAKAFGKAWGENPYMCPWCGNFHLTRKEGDPPPPIHEIRTHLNNCKQQLGSPKAETVMKGLHAFLGVYDHVEGWEQGNLIGLLQDVINRIGSLKATEARRIKILSKAMEIATTIEAN